MGSHTIFFKLRDVLAELYPDQESARVVAVESGLDERNIAFSARAQTNWYAILTEAVKTNRVDALFDSVLNPYGEYLAFRTVYDEYRRLVEGGQHLVLPRPGHSQTPTRIDILRKQIIGHITLRRIGLGTLFAVSLAMIGVWSDAVTIGQWWQPGPTPTVAVVDEPSASLPASFTYGVTVIDRGSRQPISNA